MSVKSIGIILIDIISDDSSQLNIRVVKNNIEPYTNTSRNAYNN